MLAEMTVHEKREVEIPDIPEDVMAFVRENRATVTLYVEMQRGGEGEYAELWFHVDTDEHTRDDEDSPFSDRIADLPGWDEGRMLPGGNPWFQSDESDGYSPCVRFIRDVKRMHPDVRFT